MGRHAFALALALVCAAVAIVRHVEAQSCAFTVDTPVLTFGDHFGFYSARATVHTIAWGDRRRAS